jgi:hypothetical protein
MSTLIYKTINALLRINARFYGRGASWEVCRDLSGEWRPFPCTHCDTPM